MQRVLETALHRRSGVRFAIALALGCRQGEALGLRWENLDEQNRTPRARKALQRQKWLHGAPHRHGSAPRPRSARPETAMEVMGWSSVTMKHRYMHVTDTVRSDVADRLNACFRES